MTLATIAIIMACLSLYFSAHSIIMARRSHRLHLEAQQLRHDKIMADLRQQT